MHSLHHGCYVRTFHLQIYFLFLAFLKNSFIARNDAVEKDNIYPFKTTFCPYLGAFMDVSKHDMSVSIVERVFQHFLYAHMIQDKPRGYLLLVCLSITTMQTLIAYNICKNTLDINIPVPFLW